MSYSSNRGGTRGRGVSQRSFSERGRGGNSSGMRNEQHQQSRNKLLVSSNEHERRIRDRNQSQNDRKRQGSPQRQSPPPQKRPVYDSRVDDHYGQNRERYGNGSHDSQWDPANYGSRDRDSRLQDVQRDQRSQGMTPDVTRDQMSASKQPLLFPSSLSTSASSTPLATKPLKSILKKKTTAVEPNNENISQQPLDNRGYEPPRVAEREQRPGESQGYADRLPQRSIDKSRLPGMSSYMDPEDEDKFLYGEDASKQLISSRDQGNPQNQHDASGMWRHPNANNFSKQSQQLNPITTSSCGSGLGLQSQGGIHALSNESMSTIQAALASLNQTAVSPMQNMLPAQRRQTDILAALPNISSDLLSGIKLPSNLLSGLGSQQAASVSSQSDLLASVSRLQPDQIAALGRQSADILSRASRHQIDVPISQRDDLLDRFDTSQPAQSMEKTQKDETTSTIQNILQSIGFDFGMSKRMQELAKEKEERENKVKEKDICINQTASFLGGGLSGADLTAGLFKRKDSNRFIESKVLDEKSSGRDGSDHILDDRSSRREFSGNSKFDKSSRRDRSSTKSDDKSNRRESDNSRSEDTSDRRDSGCHKIESFISSQQENEVTSELDTSPLHAVYSGPYQETISSIPYAPYPYPPYAHPVGLPVPINYHGMPYGYPPPPGLPPGHPLGPPPGFYPPVPMEIPPHLSVGDQFDEFNQKSAYDDCDSISSADSRSRSKRGSPDRSPTRKYSRDGSPRRRRSSPKRRLPRQRNSKERRRDSRSPNRRDLRSPKRRGSYERSPQRRGSRERSPQWRGSQERSLQMRCSRERSPQRRGSWERSPQRRGSRERSPKRRASRERSPRRRSRERRDSSRDKVSKESSARTGPRDSHRESKEEFSRKDNRVKDTRSESREQVASRDRNVHLDSRERFLRTEPIQEPDSRHVEAKLPGVFRIEINSSDSRRVLTTPKEPSPHSTRIVLMPKNDHIRKITVAPKPKTEDLVQTSPDIPPEIKAKLKHDHDERQKKLDTLEKEMDKLRKQQNEIMRKRQRQKDGHKDPLLTANSKLQEEISEQIKALRKAAEEPVDMKKYESVLPLSTDTKSDAVHTSPGKVYKFRDFGSHWCKYCNLESNTVVDMCKHLKSKLHQQKLDPYDRPWTLHTLNKRQQDSKAPYQVLPLQGSEFMMSVDAFYCSLCNEFMGDLSSAEAHLKDIAHYKLYEAYVAKNPFYQKRYMLEKSAKLAIKKEEKEQELRKDVEKRNKTNKEKDTTRIKEREKKWDKKVDDLLDDARKKSDTAEDDQKQYGKFKWKKEGKGLVNKTAKLVQEEDEVAEEAPAESYGPKPKLFLPDASEANFPKPGETKKNTTTTKLNVKQRYRKNSSGVSKEEKKDLAKIPIVVGRIARPPASSTVLPSWTPVTRKIPGSKDIRKLQPQPIIQQQSKIEAENQTVPLGQFLSMGQEGKDKALPVVPELSLTSIPLPPTPTSNKQDITVKTKEEIIGLKLPVPIMSKAVPPVSQNLYLPEEELKRISSSNDISNGTVVVKQEPKEVITQVTKVPMPEVASSDVTNPTASVSLSASKLDNFDEVAMDVDSPAPVSSVEIPTPEIVTKTYIATPDALGTAVITETPIPTDATITSTTTDATITSTTTDATITSTTTDAISVSATTDAISVSATTDAISVSATTDAISVSATTDAISVSATTDAISVSATTDAISVSATTDVISVSTTTDAVGISTTTDAISISAITDAISKSSDSISFTAKVESSPSASESILSDRAASTNTIENLDSADKINENEPKPKVSPVKGKRQKKSNASSAPRTRYSTRSTRSSMKNEPVAEPKSPCANVQSETASPVVTLISEQSENEHPKVEEITANTIVEVHNIVENLKKESQSIAESKTVELSEPDQPAVEAMESSSSEAGQQNIPETSAHDSHSKPCPEPCQQVIHEQVQTNSIEVLQHNSPELVQQTCPVITEHNLEHSASKDDTEVQTLPQDEDSNETIIETYDQADMDTDNFLQGMTVIDDDDANSEENEQLAGMTIIDCASNNPEEEDSPMTGGYNPMIGVDTLMSGDMTLVDLEADNEDNKPDDDFVDSYNQAVSGVTFPIDEESNKNISEQEGGATLLGLTVTMIDNFSEESNSSKRFDPCLADSIADESVSLADGITVLEASDSLEPEDTICPDEYKGISLEMPGDQEDLNISDGESVGSSINMGSDFEVVDDCDDDLEVDDADI